MKMLIQGGRIIDPSQELDEISDVLIADGRIQAIDRIPASIQDIDETVDAKGLIVAPGFIDMHVHLREPGREDKETVASGAHAAVAGGFTSVMCMPNTSPVNDNEAITRFVLDQARKAGCANVFPAGAVTVGSRGQELAEIGEMVKAGAVAISDDGNPIENNQMMRRALEYARIFDIPVIDHCEDRDLAARGCMNEGAASTRLGLAGMSRTAEEMDVVRDLILSRETRSRAHIAHLSTEESLEWIRLAKQQEIQLTCEVTPHHFILRDKDIANYDTNFKMNPPLREARDVEAMLAGLADGSIDCIATDHAPHTSLEKDTTFVEAANGIVGLESAVSLCWHFLVAKEVLGARRLIELLSCNPSRILGLDRGTLKKGAIADLTLIDPSLRVEIDRNRFYSKSRNTPFHGWKLQGGPTMTIVEGEIVFARGELRRRWPESET